MCKGVNEGLSMVMKNWRRYVTGQENYLWYCHSPVKVNASNTSSGAMRELDQISDQCIGHTPSDTAQETHCLWALSVLDTHSILIRGNPSVLHTWYDPRETQLWKRSLEIRVNGSRDLPEHSFYSMLMKPGLDTVFSSKTTYAVSCFNTACTKRKSWRKGKGTEYDVFCVCVCIFL